MPLYRDASKDAVFVVPFLVDGEYVVPEVGSVSFTVYDNSGTAIPALTDVAVSTTVNSTTAVITVPAANNDLGTLETAFRRVAVAYTHDGHPHTHKITYVLHGFAALTVDASDCRALLGFDEREIPDGDFDVIAAYLRLKADTPTLPTLLAAGGRTALDANDAVRCAACLDAMPAIRRRATKRTVVDGITTERATTDLDRLERDLRARLAAALTRATGATGTTPVLFVVGTRTDELTGA